LKELICLRQTVFQSLSSVHNGSSYERAVYHEITQIERANSGELDENESETTLRFKDVRPVTEFNVVNIIGDPRRSSEDVSDHERFELKVLMAWKKQKFEWARSNNTIFNL